MEDPRAVRRHETDTIFRPSVSTLCVGQLLGRRRRGDIGRHETAHRSRPSTPPAPAVRLASGLAYLITAAWRLDGSRHLIR